MRIFLFFFLFCGYQYLAQKQGNIWYFGKKAGLNFNTNPVSVLLNGQVNSQEGSCAISDSAGSLLFYSDGVTIWNKNHQVMKNGSGLLGNQSSTQSSIIVPDPANPNKFYYLFTVSNGWGGGQMSEGLRFSKIDICADSSRGEVQSQFKNIKILDSVAEKLAVVRDSNGIDFWLVTHKLFSSKFISFKITAGGVTNSVVSNVGSTHDDHSQGQLKISPDGKRLAVALTRGFQPIFEIFDFNISTGLITNPISPQNPPGANFYGLEFSSNSTKLYGSGSTVSNPKLILVQYDLSAGGGSPQAIDSSMYNIQNGGFSLQLGPDNKIYLRSVNSTNGNMLAIIQSPDLPGSDCNFQDLTLSLGGGKYAEMGLPSFIAGYNYNNGLINCCQVPQLSIIGPIAPVCEGAQVLLMGTGASSLVWNNSTAGYQLYVTPSSTSIYSLSGSNGPGCDAMVLYTVTTKQCVGINENDLVQNDLIIYPNPSKNRSTIKSTSRITRIIVSNSFGQILYQINETNDEFETPGLKPGIYHISVSTADRHYMKKLIITN